jgi:hypothetical protein
MSVDERRPRIAVVYYSATGNVHATAALTPVRAS